MLLQYAMYMMTPLKEWAALLVRVFFHAEGGGFEGGRGGSMNVGQSQKCLIPPLTSHRSPSTPHLDEQRAHGAVGDLGELGASQHAVHVLVQRQERVVHAARGLRFV